MIRRSERNRKNPDETAQLSSLQRLSGILDMPQATLTGIPQIELAGNREAIIDGCQGILEYNEDTIKLTTGRMSVKFTGRGLQIKVLTHDSAVIEGFISNIEFFT